MTYAEGLYRRRHKKQVESTEDYLHRVTVAYNEIYSLINKVSDSKVFRDAYNQKFKIKTWLFSKILSHMMEKLGREGTIFYLMSSMRKIQKQNR